MKLGMVIRQNLPNFYVEVFFQKELCLSIFLSLSDNCSHGVDYKFQKNNYIVFLPMNYNSN